MIGDPLDRLLAALTETLASRQRLPESTYRLQFNTRFTFRAAAEVVPYLRALGITDVYASPYLKARAGSGHGYDITDHGVLNPEIGTAEDYDAFVAALRAHGMGQVLDVVPNHMGIAGNDNAWWNHVLENGPSSPYAGFFDIEWYPLKPDLDEKVLLPVLGDPYGKVLESGEIQLRWEAGAFTVHYFAHGYPVAPRSYPHILAHRIHELEATLGADASEFMEYQSILTGIRHLPPRNEKDPERIAERQREKEVIKRRLATLAESATKVREFIEHNVVLFNGRPGVPASFDLLDALLNEQAYRLAYWRVASDEINYRRFFDVNELAALSMEKPEVFEATHRLILQFLGEGKVTGIRVDHPDGLYDPRQYLRRLQEHYVLEIAETLLETHPDLHGLDWRELEAPLTRLIHEGQAADDSPFHRPLYVVVEKILGKGEPIPEDWPVHGTTGYEFLNQLNGLFVDQGHESAFNRIDARWTGVTEPFWDLVQNKKFLILQVALSSELHMLAYQLDRLSERNRWSRDFTLNSLRHALREIIACFPVYRSYIMGEPIQKRDRYYVEAAVARAKQRNPAISASIFDFVRDMLLLRGSEHAGEADREAQRRFVGKFQQVTGPVMAKGLEDTALYVYNRLVSLNEVGGDPERFGVAPPGLHRYFHDRQKRWAHALSATSTHDTKRSEDVRARLNVLSEIPKEWRDQLRRWSRLNKRHLVQVEDGWAPDRNEEYLFYQNLLGVWPIGPEGERLGPELVDRIQSYMQKAIHEAKVHTSWVNPNPAYDDAIRQFVSRVLDDRRNTRFLQLLRSFQRRLSHFGMFNSLAQTLVKITAPGASDIYQGSELWDFSLVDPDNRRPVDYECRQRLLQDLDKRAAAAGPRPAELAQLAQELTDRKEDGRIKLYVTSRALRCRRDHPDLFTVGNYLPGDSIGSRREHVFGFVRRRGDLQAAVAVPRLLARLNPREVAQLVAPLGSAVWNDTVVLFAGLAAGHTYRNVFTGEALTPTEHEGHAALSAADLFAHFPVALLLP